MNIRHKILAGACILSLGAGISLPVAAQEATAWPELMMKMADTNKDGMVTRQEYLEMAGKIWDMKHAKMMKADATMKKGMMNKAQYMDFTKGLFQDPGLIGGS